MKKGRRQPKEIWQITRKRIWERDRGRCQGPYCQDKLPESLPLSQAHIDHIIELCRGGTNKDSNLRSLCRRCHCLRSNGTHRGMTANALRAGIIDPNWREQVWDEEQPPNLLRM